MADKLVFPIYFDLEEGVKEAQKDIEGHLRRIEIAIKNKPIEVKIDTQGFEQLGQSMKTLTAHLATLNNILSATGRESADAQQEVTRSIEEQGRVVANTTNTVSRQLMAQERVNKALRETYAEQERVNRLISQYHDTYEGQIASLAKLNSQLAFNKKAQSDNEKALKDNSITTEQYAKRNAELLAQYRQLTQEKRTLSQIMTAEEKAMMAQEGSYVQLSQQLSLLKKAYKELGDEGRTSLFGQDLEGAIQNLDARLKDMAADMGEFQRNVGNYAIAGQNGVVATESLTAAINQEARTTQDLIDQTRILEEAKRMLNTNDANYTSTLETINAKLEENKRKLSDISDILGKEAKSVAEAEAQNKRLSEALKHVDLTSADAKKRLEEIRTQIERNNATIAAATGANERYAESLLGLVGINANFGSSLQSLGNGGSFIDGLKTKVQAFGKTLMGLLTNPLVLSFLGVAGVVAGFKWWYDYNKGLIEASRLTENFTGLSGEAADKVTADMQALADHMGQGYDKTISAANALVQQFGISWEKAMKLMQDGITAGADMSGNMVSNIERFAPALRDAGVSADEFMSILAETRNGIFNEQGIQLIVRAGGRLKAMTKQMAESLDAAGISSKKLQKDLTDGTMTMFDAVQKVATKLKELPENSQEAGNIMKHVFGRIAAEGGVKLIQSIADVNTNLEKAKDNMGELGMANEAQMNAQKELNEALMAVFKMSGTSFEVLTTRAKTFVTQGLTKIIRGCVDIVNWFINLYNEAIYVRIGVANIVATFKTLWTVTKGVFELLINGFKGVGGVMEGVALIFSGKFEEGATRMKDAITNGFKGMKDIAIKSGKEIGNNYADAFMNVAEKRLNKISTELNADGIDDVKDENYNIKGRDKNGGGGFDSEAAKTYLQTLNKIEQSLSTIYAKYTDLEKKEGVTKALGHINELYKTQLDYINELGKQFGLSFKMPTAFKDLQSYRSAILDVINKLKASGIKGADNAALDFEMKIGLGNIDDMQKKLEQKLKKLSDRISRTKTAKEFYEKILSQTGDIDLAMNVTMSIFGTEGGNIQELLANEIQQYFGEYEVEIPVIAGTDKIDYKRVRELAKAAYDAEKIGKDAYDALDKIATDGEKDLAKIAEQGTKLLLKFDEIAQQRVNIEQEASEKIRQLREAEAIFLASNASEQEKAAYKKRTDKAVAGVEADRDLGLLKLKDEYLRFFSAIHSLTNKEAETLRTQVRQALFKAFQSGAISADQLKKELKAVDEQFRKLKDDSGMAMDYLKGGFDGLIQRVRDTADELQSVAAEISKMESPDQISEGQKSFIDKILGKFGNESTGKSFADLFSKAKGDTAQMAGNLQNCAEGMEGMAEGAASTLAIVDRIITDVARTIEGVAAIRDQLNEMRSEDNQLEGGFWDAFEYLENFNKYAAKGWEDLKSGNIVGAVQNTVQSIISIFGTAQAQRVRKANKEIKRQAEILESLQYTYERLQAAADKLFGADYISNYNQQMKNLEAQQTAYLKQAEAERSKGKKADEEKIKEYENAARDTANEIKKMQEDLTAHFTGTSRQDAAREFARSWLEAKATFASTADAIKSKYKDMLQSMIIEGAASRVIDNALSGLWQQMDKAYAENDPMKAIEVFANGYEKFVADADKGMEVLWKALESRGIDLKNLLKDTDTNYTGIKRDIAGASEETMSNVATIGNTLMYYVSPIPGIATNVAMLTQHILNGGASAVPTANAGVDFAAYHTQSLEHLNTMTVRTSEILAECQRLNTQTKSIVDTLGRVVTYKGNSHGFNVRIVS